MQTKLSRIYTKSNIIAQLKKMGVPRDKVVIMHSSLRSIGKTENGAKTILDAMIEYFTEEGGLFAVPTHTWADIGKDITLDMTDRKTCLGAFSAFALSDSRGIRSENPTHSLIVFGDREKALKFIDGELRVTSGTSPESCYGKMIALDGYILLVGVNHARNTFLHSAEDILGVKNRLSHNSVEVSVKLNTGEVVRTNVHPHKTDFTSDVSLRYPKYETVFRYFGAITDGFIGNAPTQACSCRGMLTAMETVIKNAKQDDVLANEFPIPQKLYCKR